jgi:hypothetical protein
MNPIREAAARVPGHWHQGSYRDNEGNACGLGHLFDVLEESNIDMGRWYEEPETSPAMMMQRAAYELFPERFEYAEQSFAGFNDHKDTTESEVVAVMEKAAVRFDELN